MKFLGAGGVGSVLEDFNSSACRFCLKIVCRSGSPVGYKSFWNAAKAIQAWTADIRYHAAFVKLPLAQQYWIKESDCNLRTLNLQRLSSLITRPGKFGNYPNCPEALKDIDPEEYVLCPKEILEDIYKKDLCDKSPEYSLLITYPVQKGNLSIAKYIEEGNGFSEQDLLNCCYQILSAIDYLYERGCAHRDIKPGNILVDEHPGGKEFRLIDFDAFHSEEQHHSTSGTSGFLPHELTCKELNVRCSPLEYRVLLDCFALAQTISCMYSKSLIPPYRFPSDIPQVISKLYRIGGFDPSQIKKLLSELEERYNCRKKKLKYTELLGNEFDFDSVKECHLGELGTFHEQIRFSDKFDPLIKNSGKHFCTYNVPEELYDIIHLPLCKDRWNIYFHAPDNAKTGLRPSDFTDYTPKSMANTSVSEKEAEKIISYGKKLNNVFNTNLYSSRFLPEKQHIVWVDGEIRIFWGLGNKVHFHPDYEAYFRYLLTGETDFSSIDWQNLLPLFPELEYKLTTGVCRELFTAFVKEPEKYSFLWGIKKFRENIEIEESQLQAEHWLIICHYTDIFDQYIDEETVWKIFLTTSGKELQELQKRHKLIAKVFYGTVPHNFELHELFKAFFKLRNFDEENFRHWFGEICQTFSSRQWSKFICCNPALQKFMPEELLPQLTKPAWIRLLGHYPEFAGKCNSDIFSSENWCSILLQQPSLGTFLPSNIIFSDSEKERLKKNQFFS